MEYEQNICSGCYQFSACLVVQSWYDRLTLCRECCNDNAISFYGKERV